MRVPRKVGKAVTNLHPSLQPPALQLDGRTGEKRFWCYIDVAFPEAAATNMHASVHLAPNTHREGYIRA